jgi:hypothetical protein
MKTLATLSVVIFAIVFAITIYIGLDLKKWQTWLFGVYGFLTFFLVGLIGTGNVIESIKVGAIVAFATIFVGVTTSWNRERAKKWLREHEARELESIQKLDMRNSSKKRENK